MSNNNLNLPSSYENNFNLDEFTKCYICLCKIQDATMCPNCQKISCHRCIQVIFKKIFFIFKIIFLEMANRKEKSMSSL
jgi:hypothetical protein